MQQIKYALRCLFASIVLLHILSCGKKDTGLTGVHYADIVAQDPSYRLGKWYSVTDSGSIPLYNHNTRLDTIWFINDSLAGWTGFGGNPYEFWPTYFSSPYDIVYLAPDPFDTTKIDTITHECGMTTAGDTFVVYWPVANYQVLAEKYIKMKN